MTTHTITGFITYEREEWEATPRVDFKTYDPRPFSHFDGVVVAEHSIEVEVPDGFDPRPGQIAALQEKKEKARAAFALAVKQIDDRINSLLAIENRVEA